MAGRSKAFVIRGDAMRVNVLAVLAAGACAGPTQAIEPTPANQQILKAVEQYRLAVESKDVEALLAMVSRNYWEDAGTPSGSDDYGFDGLREVLSERFKRAGGVRY